MTLLGALLAGGRSSRFGSDKALALLDGRPLIEHVAAALRPQTDALVVCGREQPGYTCAPDRPAPHLGPLGGLAAALHHALVHGFDAVLAVPCDVPLLPRDLAQRLRGASAAIVAGCPVVGYWPAALAPRLEARLTGAEDDRSLHRWARAVDARVVVLPKPFPNVNMPSDLAGLRLPKEVA